MNRRNFLKRAAAVSAAIAVVPLPEKGSHDYFPESIEQMKEIVSKAKSFQARLEGKFIPEGLSRTLTPCSVFWYYHKGDRIAVLHRRSEDNHECFYIQTFEPEKATYNRPLSSQWAKNRKHNGQMA